MKYERLFQLLIVVPIVIIFSSAGAVTVISVDSDGSGDYTTVQAAVDSISSPNNTPVEIHIAPGAYVEHVNVTGQRAFVSLIGSDPLTTKITSSTDSWNDPSYQTVYFGSPDFSVEGLSIENSWSSGVAVAFFSDSQRGQFKNVRFLSGQDTLKLNNGPYYFVDCRIEGSVDFMWGGGTAWFENCEIYSRSGGYLTACAGDTSIPYGFVFNNCQLTRAPSVSNGSVYLGRPWYDYASVTYLNCWMDAHIHPDGWAAWGDSGKQATCRYNEYNSSGPGGDTSSRVGPPEWPGVHILTVEEAAEFTLRNVIGGWSPTYADELWQNADEWTVININCNSGTPPAASAGQGVLGDGCSGTGIWNNQDGPGTLINLGDTQGNATPVGLVIPTDQGIWAWAGSATAVQCPGDCGTVIMQEYLTNNNDGMKDSWITGLKANSKYDLYLYGHGDQENQNTMFIVNGVTKACTVNVGGLTELTENAHDVVFQDAVSDANGQIQIRWGNTSTWGALNGLQIIQRPYGDLDRDKYVDVDMADLDLFVNYWLTDSSSLDLNGDDTVNLYEFSRFAQDWLLMTF